MPSYCYIVNLIVNPSMALIMDDVLAVAIPEAARRLGVCPRTIVNLIEAGELVSRKIGRRRVIPVAALVLFLRHDHIIEITAKEKNRQGLRRP
jgi:excisionase family DNA binding protein